MLDTPQPSQRLDSWKAISDYLGRDERTVRRWEKELGLPVRRVPGRRGHSVFAYVSEIESWLRTNPPAQASTEHEGTRDTAVLVPAQVPPEAAMDQALPTKPFARRLGLVAAAVLLAGLAWRGLPPRGPARALRVQATASAVVATDAADAEVWRYSFPADERAYLPDRGSAIVPVDDATKGTLVVVAGRVRQSDGANLSGQVLWIDPAGARRHTATLDDHLRFRNTAYGAPWSLTEGRLSPGVNGRLAVAAHHYTWWPGVVGIFDGELRRIGTFVNAGWVEGVRWVTQDRLVVAGFSNAHDGGMVALLGPDSLDGQSPEPAASAFHCDTCGAGAPVRYVVLPRSELNRLTGSGFNRARLQVSGDRVQIRTDEVVEGDASIADAVYEFTASLDLVSASFSDRYWDVHRALEAQGKIGHTREQCPYRDGPNTLLVWEAQTGWRQVAVSR
jgi:hypothetical protein